MGTLDPGEAGQFSVKFLTDCAAPVGATHCSEAHIYPDTLCPTGQPWSGAEVSVEGRCENDTIFLSIKNTGSAPNAQVLDYVVVEDVLMMTSGTFNLVNNQSMSLAPISGNGATYRLQAQQEPGYPYSGMPSVSVEGCGGLNPGMVTVFPTENSNPAIAIYCRESINSYDPNDKQAFPKGYGTAHYIRPGTPLEYQIRFQNTGNDTAFTVRLVDTLSAWLDPTTLRPGASSHAYTWDLNGAGVLTFLYENILLADSIVDEPGSHGFVKFTINHQADAPLETVIENTAEIYFDFNEAIVTNTTFHRLGENFVTVGLWQPEQPRYAVSVSPNPFSDAAILEVKGLHQNTPLHLQVFDLQGKLQLEMDSDGTIFQLKKGGLPTGVYLFKIDQKGKSVGAGKLIIQDQ